MLKLLPTFSLSRINWSLWALCVVSWIASVQREVYGLQLEMNAPWVPRTRSRDVDVDPFGTATRSTSSRGCSVSSATMATSRDVEKNLPLISAETSNYIDELLGEWNSTGLAVAVVQKTRASEDPSSCSASMFPGWNIEFGSYGYAKSKISSSSSDGKSNNSVATPITPDTLFAIASNSKLFLAVSVGLLISNQSIAEDFKKRTGKKLGWTTRMRDLVGEWEMWDEDIERGATIQDLLAHRTGMPRHDFSGTKRDGGVRAVISTLRYLRPSATFRQTTQYNNLMYETLSFLPCLFLNQSYESYIQQHLFDPLNMTSTTFNVARAEGEFGARLAHGHLAHARDFGSGKEGELRAVVPYWFRPGEEVVWAGAGGVISTARDLATWMAMLLNDGKHPQTNEVVVPPEVLDYVTTGRVVTHGKPEFPEFSPRVYGCGQWRYAYQGVNLIEHGGNNPGFKSQVARFPGLPPSSSDTSDASLNTLGLGLNTTQCTQRPPNRGLGVITLSNDGERGGFVLEAAKWRIAEDVLGLEKVDWSGRYKKLWKDYQDQILKDALPPPVDPTPPPASFESLGKKRFEHPAYGVLTPCLVPGSVDAGGGFDEGHEVGGYEAQSRLRERWVEGRLENPHVNCTEVLARNSVRRILQHTNLTSASDTTSVTARTTTDGRRNVTRERRRATYIVPWDRTFSNYLRVQHFEGSLFNVSMVWSNADLRVRERRQIREDGDGQGDEGDLLFGLDQGFEVEWVNPAQEGDQEEGLAFKRGFWGREGIDSEDPEGEGRAGAEVWFRAV